MMRLVLGVHMCGVCGVSGAYVWCQGCVHVELGVRLWYYGVGVCGVSSVGVWC